MCHEIAAFNLTSNLSLFIYYPCNEIIQSICESSFVWDASTLQRFVLLRMQSIDTSRLSIDQTAWMHSFIMSMIPLSGFLLNISSNQWQSVENQLTLWSYCALFQTNNMNGNWTANASARMERLCNILQNYVILRCVLRSFHHENVQAIGKSLSFRCAWCAQVCAMALGKESASISSCICHCTKRPPRLN